MKTCLVTGGAGFIGSHLVDKLLNKGYQVTAVDNLSTGNKDNIKLFLNNRNFIFQKIDVTKKISGKFNLIFHLASPASPNKNSSLSYMAKPVETMLVNSVGTYNLLELSKNTGAKFLFASTSEVYGDPKEHPQKESYWGNVNPNGIRSCYDESKRLGEAMTLTYVRKFEVDGRIVRIFNTYGPRMADDGRAIVEFIQQGLTGKPFTIFGSGTQTRSFCYVDDLVNGIIKAMETEKTKGEVFNLGNPDEYSINELINILAKQLKIKIRIRRTELPEDDPVRRRPDITKAKKILDWEPKVQLEQGLQKTIEYWRWKKS